VISFIEACYSQSASSAYSFRAIQGPTPSVWACVWEEQVANAIHEKSTTSISSWLNGFKSKKRYLHNLTFISPIYGHELLTSAM
jgi:hypothetical protein